MINTGVKMVMGSYKNSEALGEIGKDTKNAIAVIGSNFAFSKDALFKLKLQSNYADQGEYLFNTMAGSYSNCAQVESIAAVNDFKGYDVKSVCDEVAKILARKDFDSLKSYFKESVGQLIISIQKNEILKPATDQVGMESASRIAKFIEDKFKEYQKENFSRNLWKNLIAELR